MPLRLILCLAVGIGLAVVIVFGLAGALAPQFAAANQWVLAIVAVLVGLALGYGVNGMLARRR